MKSIKQKTISGLVWSFIDNFIKQGLAFIIGIILARLLSPREFGLIGMTTVFIAISQSFIDSGFTQALIRKKECTQEDFSTVFFFNLFAGLLLYSILFLFAGKIGYFFDEPQLSLIIKVLGLGLVINAFAIIQRARLTKNIDFKLQTKISFYSTSVSGIIGIILAYKGYGVWSLVIKTLSGYLLASFFFWIWNKWKPTLVFSYKSFKEMFSFGSRLLLSGLIDTIYKNIYLLIIGKFFNAAQLGFYTRAYQFTTFPSQNVSAVIQRVSYPVLSDLQDEKTRLKNAYQKLIKNTMFLTFLLMIGMAAVAKPLVLVLIGSKWTESIIYLQLLCFAGMLYPLHAINLNMLNVMGRSDLFLRLEIIKKLFAIPTIIVGVMFGIKIMIIGMIINSVIAYFLNSYYSGKFIDYSNYQQIKDIVPSLFIALITGMIVFISGYLLEIQEWLKLIVQLTIGILVVVTICETIKFDSYLEIKEIISNKIKGIKNKYAKQ